MDIVQKVAGLDNDVKMAPGILLGIDVGTTMTKAAAFDLEGRELGSSALLTSWRVAGDWREADPDELFDTALDAAQRAIERLRGSRVVGIGVCSMAETTVLLNEEGEASGPAVAWNDPRGAEEAKELGEVFGEETFASRTGMWPSSIQSVAKLAHLSRKASISRPRGLSVADWIVYRLCGVQAMEASLASRTGAFQVETGEWWEEVLEWAGLGRDFFPDVVHAGQLVGRASEELGEGLGGAAVAPAGHDHLAVAVGAGVIGEGEVLDSVGTAEALVRSLSRPNAAQLVAAARRRLGTSRHVLPDRWALLAGQSFGQLLRAVGALVGIYGQDGMKRLEELGRLASPNGLVVEREGGYGALCIRGVTQAASPGALWRAAWEALERGWAELLARLEEVSGPAEELVLTGGWAAARAKRLPEALGSRRLWLPEVREAGARGAALFGGMAAGIYPDPAAFPRPAWQAVVAGQG